MYCVSMVYVLTEFLPIIKEYTMNHINKDQGNHLSEINRLLSMYRVLSFGQLAETFPELTEKKRTANL